MSRPVAAGQDGFTLIELLVSMVLSLIVLFAILQSLDLFSSNAAQQNRQTSANDTARSSIDQAVDELRSATTIRRAASTDLVYSLVDPSGQRTVRLCVAGSALYRSVSTTTTVPTSTCGVDGGGFTQGLVARLPAATSTAFTYDGATASASPATVRSVGITLNLDASGGGTTAGSTLRASATVRRTAGALAVDPGDVTASCNSSGALLSLTVTPTNGLGGLGVTYATDGGIALGSGTAGGTVQIPKGITNIIATVTDTAGITSTVQKVVECS